MNLGFYNLPDLLFNLPFIQKLPVSWHLNIDIFRDCPIRTSSLDQLPNLPKLPQLPYPPKLSKLLL